MTIIEEGWLETLLHVLQNIYYKFFLSDKKKDLFKKENIPKIDWDKEHTTYNMLNDNQKVIFKSWIQNILDFYDGFTKVYDNYCFKKGNLVASRNSFIGHLKGTRIYKEFMIIFIIISFTKISLFIYSIITNEYRCQEKSFTNCSCSYNNRENIINNYIYNDIDYFNRNKTLNITNYNNLYLFNNTYNGSISNNISYYIYYNIEKNAMNISNYILKNDDYENKTNFWFCRYGKCYVKKIKFSLFKAFKLLYFIVFDLPLIIYKLQFLFTFKKIQLNDNFLVSHQIIEYIISFCLFFLNYTDNEKCMKIEGNIFNKNNKIDYIILIVDIILNKILLIY